LYELKLKPTGHSLTNPAATEDFSLSETHNVYQSGKIHNNAKAINTTVMITSNKTDPNDLSLTI
jgi:hypothetical protein